MPRSCTARARSRPPRWMRCWTAMARGETDEFIAPTVIRRRRRHGPRRRHRHPLQLPRRPRTPADPRPRRRRRVRCSFDRGRRPRDLLVVTMTEYEGGLPVRVAFPPLTVSEPRRDLLAPRLAPVPRGRDGEVRPRHVLLQWRRGGGFSGRGAGAGAVPKVATYDLQPEMSAAGVTDALVGAIESGDYDFIVANYANPDMVGHTGVWDATITACRVRRRLPGARGGCGAGRRRVAVHHGRPRQRRRDA